MTNFLEPTVNGPSSPQCQFFVMRKKRLCRMTVRPGRQYCGEHEPRPNDDGKATYVDTRIPCPYDSKHTCYASKLEKHLLICNARETELPPYIVQNINIPEGIETHPRKPLSEIPKECLMQLIHKVNLLYEKYVQDNISKIPEHPIHSAVLEEFMNASRTESSLRHLRQASSLLHIVEEEGLVQDGTCYVELGAGKGHLSYYACVSWCGGEAGSRVVAVDRAALRHKRDNAPRAARAARLRADLAHLALHRAPPVATCGAVVGIAKHLCGAATDYALRCVCHEGMTHKSRGAALATCCHHRCRPHHYVGDAHLRELGITGEELNIMLGVVSWATCGDGRSREHRKRNANTVNDSSDFEDQKGNENISDANEQTLGTKDYCEGNIQAGVGKNLDNGNTTDRSQHVTISSDRDSEHCQGSGSKDQGCISVKDCDKQLHDSKGQADENSSGKSEHVSGSKDQDGVLTREYREEVGRRAKALLDWGRVLYLRERGFEAKLCYYVPTSVSLENLCIIAKKVT